MLEARLARLHAVAEFSCGVQKVLTMFANTPVSAFFRDRPGGLRNAALFWGPEHWRQIEVREQAKGLEECLGRRRSVRHGGRNVAQQAGLQTEMVLRIGGTSLTR